MILSCSNNPMIGHWSNEETDTKMGLFLIDEKRCSFYVSPPNHSSFVGNCEYEIKNDKYYAYSLKDDGARYPDAPFVYEYNIQTNTLVWLHEEGRINLHKQKH